MVTVRPNTYVYSLIELLGVVGEYPVNSVNLVGNERVVKAMIHRGREMQKVRMRADGRVYSIQLFNISGHGKLKTLRLTRDALMLLGEIDPKALAYYLASFRGHHFTGNESNIDRNHRVAETVAMCKRAGVEFRPYLMPELTADHTGTVIMENPCCYASRLFKQSEQDSMNKIGFTRTTGLLFSSGNAFALYNARSSTMKWSGTGERKAYYHLYEIIRSNSSIKELDSAILFAKDSAAALATLMETERENRFDSSFSSIYRHIHFVPLNNDGVELLRLLLQRDFRARLLSMLLPEAMQMSGRNMSMDCDGEADGHYILSHLDGDIARLMGFVRSS